MLGAPRTHCSTRTYLIILVCTLTTLFLSTISSEAFALEQNVGFDPAVRATTNSVVALIDFDETVNRAIASTSTGSRTSWLSWAGLLLSASIYGVCLTTGLPELYDGDRAMTLENVSRSLGRLPKITTSMTGLAGSIARGLGVLNYSSDREESTSNQGSRFELMILPIGPAQAAGLSLSGCFG